MTEADEQKKVIQWLRLNKIFHFATNNENNTFQQNRKYAMIAEQKAKAMGKLKGVADLTVFLPNKILMIEMKRKPKKLKSGKLSYSNSKVSESQKVFIDKVNSYDYASAYVAYGFEEAIEIIKRDLEELKKR